MAASSDTNSDLKPIKADMDQLRKDLATLTAHVKEVAGERARNGKAAGMAKVEDLSGDLEELLDTVCTSGRDSVDSIEGEIRNRPLMSLAVAFGIGMLASKLLSSR